MAFLDSIKNIFVKSIPDLVIKYSNIAKQYETMDTKRNGDRYVSAKTKTDNFNSYQTYSIDILLAAGCTLNEAQVYHADKTKIPWDKRDYVLEFQRKYIIDNYVEENNYYRMLHGLPNIDDINEIWLPVSIYEKYGVEPCAIHELPHSVLESMETLGDLDEIVANNPDAKYLWYLGRRRVEIEVARMADNYQVLYLPRLDGAEIFYRDFMSMYEECREYFLTIIYNQYYIGKYKYYDNYLAFNILMMTINRLTSTMLIRYVEREFYDVDTLRIFLRAYGIEYDNVFTFNQLKLLAKNLNIILQSKSSDQVFIDILDLMGYSNFTLMKYYLVKQHKLDQDGRPMFMYKTVKNEEGVEEQVLDMDGMYEYFFIKSEVGTYDIQTAIHDAANKTSYRETILTDDYWVDDTELKEKLASSQFNYIETKYLDMNVVYRMHSIVFETVYLTRLVLDKSETKHIEVDLPSITNQRVALFDVFILLICLLCKYYNIEPSILKTPSSMLYILGYNFEADFEAIKKEISSRRDLDNRLITYIKNTSFSNPSDVNNMYVNILELEKLLVKLMNEAESHSTYEAYNKLYRTLMWSKINDKIYTTDEGVIPDTFTEYLKSSNYVLYNYYMTMESPTQIADATDYITSKLTNMFTDTKYLKYIKIIDTTQLDAIIKLLSFFKSYTTHLKDTNLVLLLDSRYYNMIHMSSDISFNGNDITLTIPDSSFVDLITDTLKSELGYIEPVDSLPFEVKYQKLVDIMPVIKKNFEFHTYQSASLERFIEFHFKHLPVFDVFINMNDKNSYDESVDQAVELLIPYFIDTRHKLMKSVSTQKIGTETGIINRPIVSVATLMDDNMGHIGETYYSVEHITCKDKNCINDTIKLVWNDK